MVPKWPKTAPNGPLWPKMALHGPKWCFNEVPLWPKMTLHDPKCPCMTPNGPKTFLGAYYMTICQLDHHGAFSETLWGHVGLWKGPRVVQYDIISCNIPMRSVLRPFVVMQGYFGSWRAIFGHKGPFLVLFSAIMRPRGPLKRAQGGPTWHIIMLYTHGKCFRVIWAIWRHAVPFWAILGILRHSRPFLVLFWAILGPPWVPEWPQAGPT